VRRSLAQLGVVALAACVVVGAGAGASDRSQHACVSGKELRFRAADATRLVGHSFGSGKAAVVLTHGIANNLCQMVPEARRLAARGFFVLAFDLRGHGLSQRRPYPVSERFAGDVAAAVKLVRRLGKQEVHLVGHSLGGSASLVAATNIAPPATSVVSLSAPAHFRRQQALESVPRLRLPVLYLASADEPVGIADDARALHEATAASDKRLEIVPGRRHGIRILDASAAARALVEDFLRAH
jgi:alpha-beta hydrolase superfamily lysophospholipase